MKWILVCLLMVLPFFIVSCDNENGDPDDYRHPYGYMEGTFPSVDEGRKLILIFNGDTLNNKSVTFVSRGNSEKPQSILTIEKLIGDEDKTEIVTDLIESKNPDKEGVIRLIFEGVYSTKTHSFKYSGYIEPLVLFLNLEE